MSWYVGIDIGAVSATAAMYSDDPATACPSADDFRTVPTMAGRLLVSEYRRTRGKPLAAATELLEKVIAAVGAEAVAGVYLTGSGSKLAARKLDAAVVNEFRAIATGLATLGVEARTVFEMGGETSKYLRLSCNDGGYGIVDYATNGDCAAGTGSFLDQQAGRLKYAIEDVGPLCLAAERSAQIAGRCSVFAKSDMIHAQQKGYTPAEVLRGLCDAVARNFRMAVVRSHPVEAPVVLIGGVAANAAVVRAMREAFDLDESQLRVAECFTHVPAVGAAVLASRAGHTADLSHMADLRHSSDSAHGVFPTSGPLSMDNVVLLRDRAEMGELPPDGRRVDAYLGIDIGSVSTNVVLLDADGRMLKEIYTRTMGRPIEVVAGALAELQRELGDRLTIRGVGTTGSGRELIGELIGADTVNDEITCHKTGATYVGRTLLDGRTPDTIFEIGGQDSKYISLTDGVVVDFTMNEACAAGTGSFLEERAEELDIAIKGEFAELALSSDAPIRLGERCTVFMERDVNSYVQRGASKPDLLAGLAFSVVYNYINRVVRGRAIGQTVFFQGGTAYNDAVAAAFAAILGKEVIVPPHNGVIGAIGAALLAREKMTAPLDASGSDGGVYVSQTTQQAVRESRFRGYDMSRVDYQLREFTCKACTNTCQIQEFTVEGEKTYWGDKCSDRYRKRARAERQPVIDDLFALRQRLLTDESDLPPVPADAPRVGIPLTMFTYDSLPFWRTLLAGCGFRPVLSAPTNKTVIQTGQDCAVAEPCFPIIVAHGHVAALAEQGVDHILLPNLLSLETKYMDTESHVCPWHQTLPLVCRQAPGLADAAGRLMIPTVRFREGRPTLKRAMQKYFAGYGVSAGRVGRAVDAAFAAQDAFGRKLTQAGRRALDVLDETGETGIVILGRPYNVHDAGVNLSVARKLREHYGVNCIPMDMLDLNAEDIRDVNDNMYWTLGQRILAASKIVARRDNLHVIYITNFKCGPDSFLKHFVREALGKPYLTLQFDGHSNDAGMMTRCEAYLDSKGLLRPQPAETLVTAE